MRITAAHLEAKVSTINRLLGFASGAPYPTPGAVLLYSAYGGRGVHRVSNTAGGQEDLMGGCQPARECSRFLDGMIAALRITTTS